jgi:hypothetical protein
MCRIKKKNQKDQSKRNELTTLEITLVINRFIDRLELSKSRTTSLVNSINSHIIKKILNLDAIDHIFCNQSLFISYTSKTFIYETSTRKKFKSDDFESIQMIVLDNQNRPRDVILIEVLYSF